MDTQLAQDHADASDKTQSLSSTSLSSDELERLQQMANSAITFVPMGEQFDRITRTAMRLFDVPMSLVTIVESDMEWFRSVKGVTVDERARAKSFCAWVIATGRPFLVPDTFKSERFAKHPLALEKPPLRFYAGYPLYLAPGLIMGTLCLVDHIPRQFSDAEWDALQDLAGIAEAELRAMSLSRMQSNLQQELSDAQRRSLVDPVTGSWTKHGISQIVDREVRAASISRASVGLLLVEFQGLAKINQQYGLAAGDGALVDWTNQLRAALPADVPMGNLGGARFLVVLTGRDADRLQMFSNSIRTLNGTAGSYDKAFLSVGVGEVAYNGATGLKASVAELLQRAEASLLANRR
jgi:diguanylate cyclase (GGDEF)-like protein